MEDILSVMRKRHSVRRYKNVPLTEEHARLIEDEIAKVNAQSGFSIRLMVDEPEAFKAGKPHYGSFSGCRNYLVIEGPKKSDELAGYYGEHLVLFAQSLGVNSCWVALTYEKSKVTKPKEGNDIYVVIALGYGENEGNPHRSKPMEKLVKGANGAPDWYRKGAEGAMLAPTAINQQQFRIELLDGNVVRAKALPGPCHIIDLGIVKYHFEACAGKENFTWYEK